jgi:hypothetical protein
MSAKKATKRAPSPSMDDKKTFGVVAPPNAAKRQMTSIFDEPAPPPMRKIRGGRGGGSDGTSLCKVQGVVTRTKDETVNGPKGPIPKKRIDIIVTGVITNGAQDIVRTGIEGEVFLFPSRVVDTPEAAETDKKDGAFKGKERELVVSPMHTVRKLSTFSSSFYKDGKDGGETGVVACEPGMLVEINGVCVNAITKGGNTSFYLNGGKVACLMDKAPSAAALAKHMIALNSQEKMQEWSAFACSIPACGFFDGVDDLNSAQKTQALACNAMWKKLVEGAADRLGVMAGGKDEAVAQQLELHEQRIRATPPEKVAAGDTALFLIDKYDSTIAPIVQQGLTPHSRVPGMIQTLQNGGEEARKLPQQFTAPFTTNIETRGKQLNMEMRVTYVFDRDAAIEAIDKGDESPILATPAAGIAMSLSMRDFAVKFGSLLEDKVSMACTQLLPIADFAAFPKMSNIESGGAEAIRSDFPEGGSLYLDVPATLKKGSVLVSEGFVKTNLCGGGGQYVPPKVGKDIGRFDFPEKVTSMPDLEEYAYQEITYDSFDVENWAELGNIEFRVVCPNVFDAIKNDEAIATDQAKGEAFLKELGHDTPSKMKTFLTGTCLVYAVLV